MKIKPNCRAHRLEISVSSAPPPRSLRLKRKMLIESIMGRISIILIAIAVLLIVSIPATANIPGATATTGIGGRAAVFDEAFVAIADDASAIYWNPAGLASLRDRYSSTLSHNSSFSGLFGLTGIQRDFLSLAYSGRYLGVGVSMDRLGTNQVLEADDDGKILSTEGSYSELRTSFSLSTGSTKIASIGLTGNYFRIGSVTSSNDVSFDIGILSRPFLLFRSRRSESQLRLRLGTALRNSYHSLDISPQYSLAAALQLRSRWGLLSSVGGGSLICALAYTSSITENPTSKFALGMELGPDAPNLGIVKHAKLHFGVEYYPSVKDSLNWKAGIRIGGGGWWFNYAREQARFLGGSNRATINLGFDTKLVQDVTVRKIENGQEKSDSRFETTDEIAITIYLLNDISLAEVQRFGIKIVITDATDKEIDKVNYDEMDLADGYAPRYVFQPLKDWFEKLGSIQPGEYTVKIFTNDRIRWRGKFELGYDSDAKDSVKKARQLFELGNLKGAETQLLKAVQQDPSYPDTYYIAGLVSELSDDFQGARQCYMEARKLNPDEFAILRDIIESQYLKTLIEQQKSHNRQGIQLYERLKNPSFGTTEKQ